MSEPLRFALGLAAIAVVGTLVVGPRLAGVAALVRDGASAPAAGAAKAVSEPRANVAGAATFLEADRAGHFRSRVEIAGVPVEMIVDTGASLVVLSAGDARRARIEPSPGAGEISLHTANGIIKARRIRLSEVRLAGITARDVEAVVLPEGTTRQSLLGMTFLKRLSRVEMGQGRLYLHP